MIRTYKGFTLIELMVVVVIISILVGIGLPGYRGYVLRSGRTDAITALMKLAASQEKYYLQNGVYANNGQLAVAPPAGLGFTDARSERGYYNLTVVPNAAGFAVGYTATATVAGTGKQADDSECASFSIDQNGRRGANGGYIAPVIEGCWK